MMGKYQELRYALSQNPTPGPWTVRYDYVVQATSFDGGRLVPVAQPYGVNSDGTDLFANARMIAACDPDTIRALLAERDALRVALEDELTWHEAQDKAISKQPNANTGHTWWRRMQHQEHAAAIRAALGQGQGGSDAPEA